MLAILSPAKSLDLSPQPTALTPTTPLFVDDAAVLLEVVRGLRPADLQDLMGISENLAILNHERFQALTFPLEAPSSLPAAHLFDGDVYKGLDARSLDDADLAWADRHLRILSGFYGLLRPLDLTHPYRLEMGTKLENPRGGDLYAFWDGKLAAHLAEAVADHEDPVVLDLASKEYAKAVPKRALSVERLELQFKEERDGRLRVISFFAKKARGTFARWMVQNRVDRRDGLKDFTEDGYSYSKAASTPRVWTFTR